MTYASRIDAWLAVIMTVTAVAAAAGAWRAAVMPGPGPWLVIVPALVLALALPAWVFADTSYTITDIELLVRSGPFRWRVSLSDITRVTPTRSLMAGPALSLDRLTIDYGHGRSVVVSPRDQAGFVAELEQRRSGARIDRAGLP